MQAARFHKFGGPEVISIDTVNLPEVGADQLLIKVRASSINPVDWKLRNGMMNQLPLPSIMGRDLAGDVVAVGANVKTFKVGDAVYGNPASTFAEYALAKESDLGFKPKTLSYDEAAAVPVVALTAWRSLFDAAQLKAGQRVLIQAAAGGVGSFGVQFAKVFGAYVIGTASAANEAFVRELGADEFIDYRSTRFEDVVKDKNVDVIFDTIGHDTLEKSYAAVKRGGVVVTVAGQPSAEKAAQYGIQALYATANPSTATLNEIAALIDSGKVKVHISKVFPFADVKEALVLNEEGHTRGKISLHISD
jgi:NADPH:quinone reductase-like Zn-dependent oxidoreductase